MLALGDGEVAGARRETSDKAASVDSRGEIARR
jgi:hypothetical protein